MSRPDPDAVEFLDDAGAPADDELDTGRQPTRPRRPWVLPLALVLLAGLVAAVVLVRRTDDGNGTDDRRARPTVSASPTAIRASTPPADAGGECVEQAACRLVPTPAAVVAGIRAAVVDQFRGARDLSVATRVRIGGELYSRSIFVRVPAGYVSLEVSALGDRSLPVPRGAGRLSVSGATVGDFAVRGLLVVPGAEHTVTSSSGLDRLVADRRLVA
ncbi:hypothetical protein [Jatrophihabitans fulvus]